MEFAERGTLQDLIQEHDADTVMPPDLILKILVGTVLGIEYIHSREFSSEAVGLIAYRKAHNPSETPMPILHRDIKSENILLTAELVPKLADLGEARAMAENGAMTQVGTQGYTAPEILKDENYGESTKPYHKSRKTRVNRLTPRRRTTSQAPLPTSSLSGS